jgi:hypothetical protein
VRGSYLQRFALVGAVHLNYHVRTRFAQFGGLDLEITELKLSALRERQDLDRLVSLYELFQTYVEQFAAILRNGDREGQVLEACVATRESLKLELRDQESRFVEWHDGDQILNPAIFSLLDEPGSYLRNHNAFKTDILLATTKFQHLIQKKRRSLEEVHEQLSLLTSETDARAVTTLDGLSGFEPTTTKIKKADEVAEIGFKWAGRLILFAPWAEKLLHLFK